MAASLGYVLSQLQSWTSVLTAALAASALALSYRGSTTESYADEPPAAAVSPKPPEKPAPQARVDRFGDPLPEGALLRLGTIRYRAGGIIFHAALSPDGKLLATASPSGITFFDLATGKPRRLRESAVAEFFDSDGSLLAFSPDGKQMVNVTKGGNLRFWDVAAGKRLRVVGNAREPAADEPAFPVIVPADRDSHLCKVWFPPNGKEVVAGTPSNFVAFVEPSNGKILRRFQAAGALTSVAADGKTLAVEDAKRPEIILYDDAGKEVRRFRHEGKIALATLCQGGKRLVTVNDKAEIKIWDAATGKGQRTIAGPAIKTQARTPTAVSMAPDGSALFVGLDGGDILRWDLRTGKEQAPLRGHGDGVTGLFFRADGRSLVSVGWGNVIQRWDLTTGRREPGGDGYAVGLRVARSPDGRTLAAASYPGCLEFWDAAAGKRLRAYSLPLHSCSQLRFAPDGKLLAIACSDAAVRLWDVGKGRVTREWKLPATKQGGDKGRSRFEGLAWNPDGRFLAASLQDELRMWEAATGKQIWQATRGGTIAFAPDGKTLVSGGFSPRLTFQDAATGKVRFALTDERIFLNDIAFSPDGGVLATCHQDANPWFRGSVCLRDPATGAVRKVLRAAPLSTSVSFSADSKWLALSGYDGTVRIWEVATATEVLRRKGHEGWVMQSEFGADGHTVLSASQDLTALLWDLRPGAEGGNKLSLEMLWANLAAEPVKAYRSIWELAGEPKSASALLRKKLPPVKIDADERRLQALLSDLDSDDFDKRESASRALAAMGAAIEIPLRRALTDAPSAEVQHRLRGLLDALKREPTPEDHRLMRAVQVMELCSTAEARKVLREWADGTTGASLTEQAKEALKRLRLAGKAEPRP